MDNNLLIAKVEDKIKFSKEKQIITNTEFLNEFQISFIQNELNRRKEKNCIFYGGYKEAIRKALIVFPKNMIKEDVLNKINEIIGVIKIVLPNEIKGKLKHKDYLGTIMSFGLARERIGDIIVYENRAYIIALKENCAYIKEELQQEKRFKKTKIEIVNVKNLETKPIEFENINISVNSLRLDNIISEILRTSRNISQKYIEDEKVFVNYIVQTKNTKIIKENDLIVIRGSGKYIIETLKGKNKKRKRNSKN